MLDASSVPGRAFAAALHKLIPTRAWIPRFSLFAPLAPPIDHESSDVPSSPATTFPLQRGYAFSSVDKAIGITRGLRDELIAKSALPAQTLLVCTSPFWASIARDWPGPCIYYSLDFTYAYDGFSPAKILKLDRSLCVSSDLVCAVSHRIRDYLVERAGCDPQRTQILPNATRTENVQGRPTLSPSARPREIADVCGPIAGVIGNMADNLDWILLEAAIRQTNGISWIFVGPTDSRIPDPPQRRARQRVMHLPPDRVRFLGARPYNQLQSYARAFDVAVLPYRCKEPTYSGSPTRYYEHLAAGRPMLATRNVAELLMKEPLVQLVDSADQLAASLLRLKKENFCDGLELRRILASRDETWDVRARTMLEALRALKPAHSSGPALASKR